MAYGENSPCPKVESPLLLAEQFRPLSVASIWHRLWSSYHLRGLPVGLCCTFKDGLRGGIPGRAIDHMVATPALQLEASIQGVRVDDKEVEIHFLNLDAVKCFDKISMIGAATAAETFGLPARLVVSLVAFGPLCTVTCHWLATLMGSHFVLEVGSHKDVLSAPLCATALSNSGMTWFTRLAVSHLLTWMTVLSVLLIMRPSFAAGLLAVGGSELKTGRSTRKSPTTYVGPTVERELRVGERLFLVSMPLSRLVST